MYLFIYLYIYVDLSIYLFDWNFHLYAHSYFTNFSFFLPWFISDYFTVRINSDLAIYYHGL